jgi:hypothetical protein
MHGAVDENLDIISFLIISLCRPKETYFFKILDWDSQSHISISSEMTEITHKINSKFRYLTFPFTGDVLCCVHACPCIIVFIAGISLSTAIGKGVSWHSVQSNLRLLATTHSFIKGSGRKN